MMAGVSDILKSGSLAYSSPSPASVNARRALAKQLLESSYAPNSGPLGALAQTLGGGGAGYNNRLAADEETAGMDSARSAIAKALQSPNASFSDLAQLSSNPWMNQNQSGLVNSLLGRQVEQSDPLYQLQLQQGQLNYDQDLAGAGDNSLTGQATERANLATQYGLDPEATQEFVLTGKLPGGNQTVRAGVGQPIFGKNKTTGAVEPWQSMTDGTMVNISNPQADPAEYDFNPGIAAGERSGATVDAKTAAAARASMPGAEQANAMTADAMAELRRPDVQAGMQEWFSQVGPRGVYVNPGSPMGTFVAATTQADGGAFMQARQMLKGGGQITDYEGRRGEDAYSRMNAAMKSGDLQSYLRALSDFESAVAEGYAKLQAVAQGGYDAGSIGGGGAPASSGGVEDLLKKYGQ